MIDIIVGCAAAGTLTVVGYTGKRLLTKMDRIDVVVRGDGNGAPGLGEKIRAAHQEITHVGERLDVHVAKCVALQKEGS